MKKILGMLIAIGTAGLPGLANADPVDNPGPFVLTIDAGSITVGSQTFSVDPTMPPTVGGTAGTAVDGTGAVTIAMGDINFPPTTQMTPLGPITVTIIPLSDGSGNLNAVTGASGVTINVRVGLSGSGLPAGCGFTLSTLNLTTGTSGTLTGIAYSQADGTQTLVENVFSAAASDGCGGFGPLLDLFIGLPSASGSNSVTGLHSTSNPIFIGS